MTPDLKLSYLTRFGVGLQYENKGHGRNGRFGEFILNDIETATWFY